MLVSGKDILIPAFERRYAVGAFNVNNLEILQAIIEAAVAERSPVIVQTSEGAIAYAGMEELVEMITVAANEHDIPVVLHLDHGKNLEVVEQALDSGYTSVMYDGSALPFEENAANTKRVVEKAHAKGIWVEAELGALRGVEDFVSVAERDATFTDPKEARAFVQATHCDALAVAVGTSHGAYKFKGEAQLDFARLAKIHEMVTIPLVLHGASGIPHELIEKAEAHGGEFGEAQGVPDEAIKKAIALGIAKINIDSDLRLAFTAGLRVTLDEKPAEFDPRKILAGAKELITKVVRAKIQLFGSSGKAY
ncbi:MAG: class II fructose-1,6-bisphosphate aldolase [Parcubacteria group bacterium]|nr:class II fructose-1,6-bisphosphate aldolase [Parcubacteria group bacterium]